VPSAVAGYEGRFDAFGWHLIARVRRLRRSLPHGTPSLIDLGMGRGRDILFLGRHGFRVFGVDIDPRRVEKAKRRSARIGVPIAARIGDLRRLRLPRRFDVVFSSTFLNHLPPDLRPMRLAEFRSWTVPGGLHVVNALRASAGARTAPDLEPGMTPFGRGELQRYYRSWEILDSGTVRTDCDFGGRPHRHVADFVVARRPSGSRPRRGPAARVGPPGAPGRRIGVRARGFRTTVPGRPRDATGNRTATTVSPTGR